MRESVMVLCIIGNCGSKSGRDSIGFYCVPAIITNQGEEFEELTRERRNLWISAIDRADLKTKNVLQNERVCSRHFVSGRPAANWDRFNEDWVPTLHLTKKEYKKKDAEAAAERSERAKARRKSAIERQEQEAAKKRKYLNESGEQIVDIDFTALPSSSTSESEEQSEAMMLDEPCASGEQSEIDTASLVSTTMTMDVETQTEEQSETSTASCVSTVTRMDAETQTEEFEYLLNAKPSGYKAPDKYFFDTDEKIRFYTGLPSWEILIVAFEHVSKYVTRRSQSLSENLLPGDMVMADRGFTICESVGLKQAKLVIPAFTKGKSQLDPVDVERTRGIASVRIHVERVIGLLRRKYTILEGTLPTDFLSSNRGGPPDAKIPMID